MDKWEYKTIKFKVAGKFGGILDTESFNKELDNLGEQGWNLISCVSNNAAYGRTTEMIVVFKKQK